MRVGTFMETQKEVQFAGEMRLNRVKSVVPKTFSI